MLSSAEKLAGRHFRDAAQAKLLAEHAENPPTYTAPNFLAHWRHECPGRKDISTAIELKEVYVLSPVFRVYTAPDGASQVLPEDTGDLELAGDVEEVPAGRFAFVYKSGLCKAKGCGHTARSKAGRFVDSHERPPIEGRVARKGA